MVWQRESAKGGKCAVVGRQTYWKMAVENGCGKALDMPHT